MMNTVESFNCINESCRATDVYNVKSDISRRMFDVSIMLLYEMFLNIFMFSCMFFLKCNCIRLLLPISVLLSVFIWFCLFRYSTIKDNILSVIFYLLLFVFLLLLMGRVFSSDYDGNYYHKMAVGVLKNGWNPLTESSQSFADRYFGKNGTEGAIWIDHYGKATWMYAASIYSFTGNIENGKVYNVFAIVILFGLVNYCLGIKFPEKKLYNLIISIAIALNPINISQLVQYYVDGFLCSMLFILITGLTLMLDLRENRKLAWIIILPAMTILGNIKFTGLLFGGIYCIVYYMYSFLTDLKNGDKLKKEIQRMVNFVAVAFVTVAIVGYTTYIQNFLQHKNPVYPLAGEGKVDIMTGNSPAGFVNKNPFFKLFYGIFGKMEDLMYNELKPLPDLKFPFSVSKQEMAGYRSGDLRIGGFGIFFSGLLLLSLVLLTYWLINEHRKKTWKKENSYILVNILFIFILSIVVPHSWWARYAVYLYLILIYGLAVFLYYYDGFQNKCLKLLGVGVFFINSSLFFMSPLKDIRRSGRTWRELSAIRNKSIVIIQNELPGICFNLEDYHVKYEFSQEDISGELKSVYYGIVKYKEK